MENKKCAIFQYSYNNICLHCKYLEESKHIEKSQIDFIVNYWCQKLELSDVSIIKRCERYAQTLIESVKSTFSKTGFLSIAEDYKRILAETFEENISGWQGCKEYIEAHETKIKLPKEIDVDDIYHMYIEKMRISFLREKNLDSQFDDYLLYHRKLSIQLFFNEIECSCFSYYQNNILSNVIKMDIVRKEEGASVLDHGLRFICKSVADYLVADSLIDELQLGSKNADLQKLVIERIFSEPQFQVIRFFLDRRLRKLCNSLSFNIFREYQSIKENEKVLSDLIHILAKEGTTNILQLILQCVDFKIVNSNEGINIESIPTEDNFNRLNVIRFLLKHGGVNIRDQRGKTPLHYAAAGGQLEMVKFLVEHGANANIQDNEGETPLHLAAWEDRLEVIKELVNLGIDVDIGDSYNDSALVTAAFRGWLHLVEFLITLGADINLKNDDDNTALISAATRGFLDIVKLLVQLGSDIHAKDSCGDTPLHLAASRGHLSTVQFLIEHGSDIHMGDNDGHTPLHLTSISGELDIAKYLVQLGANIHVGDNKGNTPLHHAAIGGYLDFVKFLVGLGVSVDVKNAEGLTASQLALSENQSDIVNFFEKLND